MQAECLKDEELWEHFDGLDLEIDVGERNFICFVVPDELIKHGSKLFHPLGAEGG